MTLFARQPCYGGQHLMSGTECVRCGKHINPLAHCAYCEAGLDRTAETGGKTFIHILTRGAGGQMLKWHPCTRQ